MNLAQRAVEWLADSLYPRICPVKGCGALSDVPARHLCWNCRSQITLYTGELCQRCGIFVEGHAEHHFECGACRQLPPHYERARAAGHFTGALRNMIHDFKYNRALWLKHDLTDLLEGCLNAHFQAAHVDVVMPVPLHPVRQRKRTYNQAALLAAELALRIDRRYDATSLKRARATKTQTHFDASQRRRNIMGAFTVTHPEWVRSRCILLIDDVMTTGATINECARMLKKAHATTVWVLTIGRGL